MPWRDAYRPRRRFARLLLAVWIAAMLAVHAYTWFHTVN